MERYRTLGPQDDPSANVGDYGFDGANYYDRPENLQPGQVQAATNIDFTAGAAETRGGLVCLPGLGSSPFIVSTWTGTTPSDVSWSSVAYGNGVFVATSSGGAGSQQIMTSQDGITWTLRDQGFAEIWTSVAFGNGKFVVVGIGFVGGVYVATSVDGITWTPQTAAENNTWVSVCYGNGKFVAVASSGTNRVMTSTDGVTWTAHAASVAKSWADVEYGNGVYVAVANDGGITNSIMTSSDGATWTTRTSPNTDAWKSVAFGAGRFVAVAQSGAGGRAMTSTDGITWTERTAAEANQWWSIAYGGGLFVAVSIDGTNRAMFSPDGITWTAQTAAAANAWRGIGFGVDRFVAVSTTGTGNRAMVMSPSGSIRAFCTYSDPNDTDQLWIALAGQSQVGFFSFGLTPRYVSYPVGFTLTQQGTLVQANNQLYLFPGTGQTPIYWDGNWANDFVAVPDTTAGAGFESIPESNHATYYQNRLWVVNGKDQVAASDVLDFTTYDQIANSFNLNTGSADYVVCTYPFGDNSLVVFKHNSSVLLENVQGSLNDVTATEISRNLGVIGINAVTAVGPDLVYVSDRNISSIRLNLQNKLQNVTEPLSRNIGPLIGRINWNYAYKISIGYWDNRLFVAVPMDDSTVCNTILVYNFITQQWYGEWTFDDNISMNVLGFVVANYLGQLRLHVVTEDGRIFVTDQGQNDISGSIVAEISTSFTTRAYNTANTAHRQRRLYIDIETNRPKFSVAAYTDGANESSTLLTDQTYSRSESWKFNDSTYTLTNANDDYNRAYRKDYATGPNSVQCGSGFQPEMRQAIRLPLIVRRQGRLSWINITNTQGYLLTRSVGFEALPGQRSSLVQV